MVKIVKSNFCEIHKSFVVNMRYIVKYEKNNITMKNGDILPISRSMQKNVEQKICG